MTVAIRAERAGDEAAIRAVTDAAFRTQPHSDGTEADIIDALRAGGDLALSLVAENDGEILGHIAFSRVTISDGANEWYGLVPVSVLPQFHRHGVGSQLIKSGIAELTERGARGIVLLGNPAFYRRFGFAHDPALTYPGPAAEYFQRLVIAGEAPSGTVAYAAAFG